MMWMEYDTLFESMLSASNCVSLLSEFLNKVLIG